MPPAPAKKKSIPKRKPVARKSSAKRTPKSTLARLSARSPRKAAALPEARRLEIEESRGLARRIGQLAGEKKASDIRLLQVSGLSNVTDFFVIASGDADVHVKAIADHIADELSREGLSSRGREGVKGSRWILLDYVDVVVHIFVEPVRRFYALEKLWGDAPEEVIE